MSGYPRWFLLMKFGILVIFLPVITYMLLCGFLSTHYGFESDRYDDAALAISARWVDLNTFNVNSRCESHRYLAAGSEAASYPPFNAWWMITNWHKDFLAQQPACNPKE